MRYLLLPILFLLTSFNTNPTKSKSIKLAKHYKVESTFSGDTSNKESFHLIIAKNIKKKQFEIIPIANKEGVLTQLDAIVFDKVPSILSFHKNEDTVSLIVSKKGKKEKEFTVVDVNLITGKNETSETIDGKNFRAVLRTQNDNLLLFSNVDELKIIKTKNANAIKEIIAKGTKESKELLKAINKGSIDAVNTDEFVANGSINAIRAYTDGDAIVISNENEKDGITYVSKINLKEGLEVDLKSIKYGTASTQKINKQTSYVNGSKLYQLKNNKKDANVSIYNLDSDDKTDLNLRDASISKKSKGFEGIEDFVKKSARSANEPTMTINNTKNGNVSVRFDYVNKKQYSYHYNWWWHHHWMFQQQMMMMQQQQIIRNNIPRYGPSPDLEDYSYVVAEKHFFEIVLNNKSIVVSDAKSEETVYSDIDKKKHIKVIDDNTKIKHASSVFINNKLWYFGYDKKTKSFKVLTKNL